jgi:hypothetical protein
MGCWWRCPSCGRLFDDVLLWFFFAGTILGYINEVRNFYGLACWNAELVVADVGFMRNFHANSLRMLAVGLWQQNRPLNVQMVADALQKHGIKKTAVQKVMDTLTANGKISFKDYGKQRVCMADQSQFEIPDIDELDAMKKQNEQLLADVAAVRSHVAELEAGGYALLTP